MVTQFKEFRIGNRVFFGGFVADVVEVAIPAATGIDKIEGLVEIEDEVRLRKNGELGVIQRFDVKGGVGDS